MKSSSGVPLEGNWGFAVLLCAFSCVFFVLFLVLVLRFPLENPSENLPNWPEVREPAGVSASSGAGASWARGQLAWPGRVGAASHIARANPWP